MWLNGHSDTSLLYVQRILNNDKTWQINKIIKSLAVYLLYSLYFWLQYCRCWYSFDAYEAEIKSFVKKYYYVSVSLQRASRISANCCETLSTAVKTRKSNNHENNNSKKNGFNSLICDTLTIVNVALYKCSFADYKDQSKSQRVQ